MRLSELTKEDVETLLSVYADLGMDWMIDNFWSWLSQQEM